MRLASINLSNYKSFDAAGQEAIFPAIKKPISIIGHNNCGKSNLLRAILVSTGELEDYYRLKEHDFHNRDISQKIKIATKFTDSFQILSPYPGEKADKSCWGSQFSGGFINGRGDTYLNCIDENGSVIIKSEKMKAQGVPASFRNYRQNLNIIYINFHDLDKHLSLARGSLLGELFRDIKENFHDPTNTTKLRNGNEESRESVFEKLVQGLKKVLYTDMLKEFIEQLSKEVADSLELKEGLVNFEFTFSSARELYSRTNLMVTDGDGKTPLPVSSLGSGLKAMVIVSMLKLLCERNEGEKIFILEEPETFLHELYQEYLYSILCKLAENNQVIYTTHSKKFVDIFAPKSIIKLHNPEFRKSEIVQINDELELSQEAFKELALDSVSDFSYFMRSLDPNLGLILFARKVLLVEGPHDVLTYRLAFKESNLSSKNIAITATWGKDTSLYVAKLAEHFKIDRFLVHDWDLDDEDIDISVDPAGNSSSKYHSLEASMKTQFTKNRKILLGCKNSVHWNKKNLEEVLGITKKGTPEIAAKLSGKSLTKIKKEYPKLFNTELLTFMEVE